MEFEDGVRESVFFVYFVVKLAWLY